MSSSNLSLFTVVSVHLCSRFIKALGDMQIFCLSSNIVIWHGCVTSCRPTEFASNHIFPFLYAIAAPLKSTLESKEVLGDKEGGKTPFHVLGSGTC